MIKKEVIGLDEVTMNFSCSLSNENICTVYVSFRCPNCDGYGCHGRSCDNKIIILKSNPKSCQLSFSDKEKNILLRNIESFKQMIQDMEG